VLKSPVLINISKVATYREGKEAKVEIIERD
jgi:hypothetical protein